MNQAPSSTAKEQSFARINLRSFVFVTILLAAILILSGILSYFVPQGQFDRLEDGSIVEDSYIQGEVDGIAFWRVLTAPVRVFFAPGCITIIMVSVFLMIMSGVFNLVEKTHGVHLLVHRIVKQPRMVARVSMPVAASIRFAIEVECPIPSALMIR